MIKVKKKDLHTAEDVALYASRKGIEQNACYGIMERRNDIIVYRCSCNFQCQAHITFQLIDSKYIVIDHNEIHINEHHAKPNKFHFSFAIMEAISTFNDIGSRYQYIRRIFSGCEISESKIRSAIYRFDEKTVRDSLGFWQKIPSLLALLNEQGFATDTQFIEESNQLRYIYVEMPYSRQICGGVSWTRVIMLDGTGVKYETKGVMLISCTVTPAHDIIPLSIAFVDVESDESYRFFFEHFTYIRYDIEFTIMSDEFGSIRKYIELFLPDNAKYCPCAWHISQHIQKFKTEFFELILSEHPKLLDARIKRFKEKHIGAFQKFEKYLDILPVVKASPPRHDYIANVMESFNNAYKKGRKLHPIHAILYFIEWSNTSYNDFLDTLKNADDNGIIEYATRKIQEYKRKTSLLSVDVFDKTAQVFHVRKIFIEGLSICFNVSLVDGKLKCDCKLNERIGIPCEHIIKIIMINPNLDKSVEDYVSNCYRVEELSNDYVCQSFIDPDVDSLPKADIEFPPIPAMVGRRKGVKLYRNKKKPNQKARIFKPCKYCGSTNHYPKVCLENPRNVNRKDYLKEREEAKIRRNEEVARFLISTETDVENETSNDEQELNIEITESDHQTITSDTQMEQILPGIPADDSEGDPRTNVSEEELVISHGNDIYNVKKRHRRVYTQDIDGIATRTRSKSKI